MGQTASQLERADVDNPVRRVSASVRRILPERLTSNAQHHSARDGYLASSGHRRVRSSSINRLSQMFNRPREEEEDRNRLAVEVPGDTHAVSNPPLLQRTRSRLMGMLRRDETGVTGTRQTSTARPFFEHRSSYLRALTSDENVIDDDFAAPRLPSFDLSDAFDNSLFNDNLSANRATEHSRRSNLPRLTSLRPNRSLRHLTHSLRRRRNTPSSVSSLQPDGPPDQATLLSRLLSLAAAATAETLMAGHEEAFGETRSLIRSNGLGDLGGDGEDGSFAGFLRALENGRVASALRQGEAGQNNDGRDPPAQPLNFFRMFRFGPGARASESRGSDADDAQQPGPLVPIIIVGIRSVSPASNRNTGAPSEDLPPFLDALTNFPSLPTQSAVMEENINDTIDTILRPPQNGTSFRHRRRASMGGVGFGRNRISDRMDDQRDHRSPDRRRDRPWSVASAGSHHDPRPPPATPASPSPELSRISSRNSTPGHSRPVSMIAGSSRDYSIDSRRNSVLPRVSAASPLSSHREEATSVHSSHSATNLLADAEPYRIHRRSDQSASVHYPRFASGHPRRNGVVEPDHLPPLSRSSSEQGGDASAGDSRGSNNNEARSWIIYVLGGSYPENHPILTTPSLFTDNPTYEDMMLLSALLGPAKAPVATDEEVQNAGGIYTIVQDDTPSMSDAAKTAQLVAIAVSTAEGGISRNELERVLLDDEQRCLVCLCNFEQGETARKLVKCNHVFHKECIDQWLTTGRNSCPLCRQQGVNEKAKDAEAELADRLPGHGRSNSIQEQEAIGGAEIEAA